MNFRDLEIRPEHRSPHDNIVQKFYLPVLERAVSYKRSVGFFSSSALVEISKGICALAKNGGNIELVASPRLSGEDLEAISKGYELRDAVIERALLKSLDEIEPAPFALERLNLLANLIERGILDIKIAFVENKNSVGIYHEKLGYFEDAEGNRIAFFGSMNESGTAMNLNYETTDVYCSWNGEQETSRVQTKVEAFARIWNDAEENLKVKSFPKINRAILEKYKRSGPDFELDAVEFRDESSHECINQKKVRLPEGLKLYPYQISAIENWEQNEFVGIYDMATGTGKTLTALSSLERIYSRLGGNLCVIILCPYIHLELQWIGDVEKFGIKPIVAFGSSPQKDWKERLENSVRKRNFNDGEKGFFCLVSSIATFKRDSVQSKISKIRKPILLIADEAHNLGSAASLKYLKPEKFLYRLGLSATLERHFDKEGTQGLLDFFGKKCIEYGLKQAIGEGYLTPYKYYPVITTLNLEERERYLDLTKSIRQEIRCDELGNSTLSEKGKMLCIERARIVAGANSKTEALMCEIEAYAAESNLLIYCGATRFDEDVENLDKDEISIRQIDGIVKKLYEKYGMRISKFIAEKTSEERENIIEAFKEKRIQAIAAIKCLDEGVNIPSIKTAFILASSTNPKEYIQRRGRVLRLSEGKKFAEIYDFVCLPDDLQALSCKSLGELENFKALAAKEILRIQEFSKLSMNPENGGSIAFQLERIFNMTENNIQQEMGNDY